MSSSFQAYFYVFSLYIYIKIDICIDIYVYISVDFFDMDRLWSRSLGFPAPHGGFKIEATVLVARKEVRLAVAGRSVWGTSTVSKRHSSISYRHTHVVKAIERCALHPS